MQQENQELASKLKSLQRVKAGESLTAIVLTGIRCATVLGCVYLGYLALVAFAGKETNAQVGINFLASINVSVAIAWGFGIGGMIYGKRQERLRRQTVERLTKRIQELEQQIDPGRSSSGMPPDGSTRREEAL